MKTRTNSIPLHRVLACPALSLPRLTRRQVVTGVAIAVGGLAAHSSLLGETLQKPAPETSGAGAASTRTSLHDEIVLKTSPQRIYELLLDSKQFTALTGAPAMIDPRPGGAFSTFGKLIEGRNVELIPNQRIVQAWRPTHWDPGVYSIVRFELKPHNTETTIVLDHTGFPEGDLNHLEWGWNAHYWEPLKKTFT
jgi:activator of HSP90 ATPase